MTETTAPADALSREEWFLHSLALDNLPFAEMMRELFALRDSGLVEQADAWAELLQEALTCRRDVQSGLDVMEFRAAIGSRAMSVRRDVRTMALALLGDSQSGRAFVEAAGLDSTAPVGECIGRLRNLVSLLPGSLRHDKTWGVGVIAAIDPLCRRVTVDFQGRAGHEMSMEHAGLALAPVDNDHILAVKLTAPDRIERMAAADQAGLVKMALRSYGPLTPQRLQDLLVPGIVPPDQWKPFWDAARKGLKKDPLVSFPEKRSDPISLLDKEPGYDDDWFAAFRTERSLERVVSLAEELADQAPPPSFTDSRIAAVADRFEFLLKGAGCERPDLLVRMLVAVDFMGLEQSVPSAPAVREALTTADGIRNSCALLPAARIRPALKFFVGGRPETAMPAILAAMPSAQQTALNEIVEFLATEGRMEDASAVFRDRLASGTISLEMLYWLCRHPRELEGQRIGTFAQVLQWTFARLEEPVRGEKLKTFKQMRDLFEKETWLSEMLGRLRDADRRSLVTHLAACRAWPALDRNATLVVIVRLYPELQAVLASDGETETAARTQASRFTSWRSHMERQRRLEQIVNVDLPATGRDLAQARSYGDLSENHEFKAAKERQAALAAQRDAIAEDLRVVKGTSFEGFPSDIAGPGTTVLLAAPDGTRRTVHILGQWDSDERLGIVSCDSLLGTALLRRKPGDSVRMPGNEEHSATVEQITSLPPEIVAWAKGTA